MPDLPFDAVVLAGGRSSRLGGVPKALLLADGEPLLLRTLAALRHAGRVAVVGPADLADVLATALRRAAAAAAGQGGQGRQGGQQILLTREDPPFSGPAAAAAAGFRALAAAGTQAPLTMLMACDMPALAGLPEQLASLAGAAAERSDWSDSPERSNPTEAWVPVDEAGRAQQLASCVRTDALSRAIAEHGGNLVNLPVRALLAKVQVAPVPVRSGLTADVDTWADAEQLGIQRSG